jgi:hypothetical protein
MIEYRFRVHNAAVFTLYSYSKALEYHFGVPTAGSLSAPPPSHPHAVTVWGCGGWLHGCLAAGGMARITFSELALDTALAPPSVAIKCVISLLLPFTPSVPKIIVVFTFREIALTKYILKY